MGTLTGALPLTGFGSKVAAKSRVDYQNTPEGALVRRAQAGDETAFREIVERYQSKVFSIIHGIVRQRNDVEDIAQQVFAKVYLSLKSFDFRSSLITWIYKITVNECFDYLRKRKVRKRPERRRSAAGGEHGAECRPADAGGRFARQPGLCFETAYPSLRRGANAPDAEGSRGVLGGRVGGPYGHE